MRHDNLSMRILLLNTSVSAGDLVIAQSESIACRKQFQLALALEDMIDGKGEVAIMLIEPGKCLIVRKGG